jgi:tRNA (guanine26-N2/guanine27-N2)-dimethyltransferase
MVSKYEFALKPIMSYNRKHYFRLFLETQNGISRANKMLDSLSYLQHCFKCDWRDYSDIDRFHDNCPNCGSKLNWAGPLWKGCFADPKFISSLNSENKDVQKLFDTIELEQGINIPYYDIHHLSSMKRVPAPKKQIFLDSGCPNTHFYNCGVRCNNIPNV